MYDPIWAAPMTESFAPYEALGLTALGRAPGRRPAASFMT